MSERLLGVLTAMRGRHAIAKAMLRSIPKELRGWRVLTMVVMDEADVDEMRPFLRDLHFAGKLITYAVEKNSPLTLKWQKGLGYMKGFNLDALCIFGSDDVASAAFWQGAIDKMDGATSPVGVRSCWMLDRLSGKMGRFTMGSPERPVGCGRFYPRSVLDAINWILWDVELERGIDGAAEERLARFGIKFDVIDLPGMLVDVKDAENINHFDKFMDFLGAGLSRFDEIVARPEAERLLQDCGLGAEIVPLIGAA